MQWATRKCNRQLNKIMEKIMKMGNATTKESIEKKILELKNTMTVLKNSSASITTWPNRRKNKWTVRQVI